MTSTPGLEHGAAHAHAAAYDHVHSDPGPLYELEWIQKLIGHIQHCLRSNTTWLGIEQSKSQRVLDYACGNGTVSAALLPAFPQTLFRGLDIATSQVDRFNETAKELLGHSPGEQDPMWAIQGDITGPSAVLSSPEWFGFDAAIISMGLHHVVDPAGFLIRLRHRVRQNGTLIIIDWLRHTETANRAYDDHKYHEGDMTKLPEGMSIWPGFSTGEVHAIVTAAGCADVEVRVYPEHIDTPSELQGYDRMFIAKATVL
ncbi:S-adenosyl-L-methionine-dependent methyltransferase [Xylariales sp. AK1849]|nr:S-adenosyl-L-methionine-dependent methyltransferase [Xylariales sp. AK1849]